MELTVGRGNGGGEEVECFFLIEIKHMIESISALKSRYVYPSAYLMSPLGI